MRQRMVREVSDHERMQLIRRNLNEAATSVEALRVAYEDGIYVPTEKAVQLLDEIANLINAAHVDAYVQHREQAFPGIDDK